MELPLVGKIYTHEFDCVTRGWLGRSLAQELSISIVVQGVKS
jgi:hypothetical protein